MLFNSLAFLIFFGVVYPVYRLLPRRAQNLWLLAGSYSFYGWWDWRFLGLIALSTAVDFVCGLKLSAAPVGQRERRWVIFSVATNLSVLAVFKYLGFFTRELSDLLVALGVSAPLPVLDLVLPVGLSFYTFQSMAYTIDVYRGDAEPARDPLDFALFVSFFPQLVAGPIERSTRLLPQLQREREIRREQTAEGAHLILWGFFKKIFVADNLATIVGQVFEAPGPVSGPMVLLGAYAFTWQIYCDFSGYTDIARGLAKLLGIDLMINFRLPFFADSPRDLWRRWHISLSQWLRDYLYIGLGGNRRGRARTQFNLLATMLLGGLWHGANWTFIAWGAYHGGALAIGRALPRIPAPRWLAVVFTFHFTCLGFLIFRAHDMGQVWDLLAGLGNAMTGVEAGAARQFALLVAPVLLIELIQHRRGDDLLLLTRLPRPVQIVLSLAMLAAIGLLGATSGKQFIYFQF